MAILVINSKNGNKLVNQAKFVIDKKNPFLDSIKYSSYFIQLPNSGQIQQKVNFLITCPVSVSSVVEFLGAGSSRLRTINSELNGAI